MKISSHHLKRYKEIVQLFWKYGRSDLVKQMSLAEGMDARELQPAADGKATPDDLANDLEAMGPTFVKVGQMLSGRPDLLPDPYLKALQRLQDHVKPFSFEEVENIVHKELGIRISKAFSSFDPKPLAAASLSQVHSAALRDGRLVVVKVQRPDIVAQIAEDFEVLAEIAEFLDSHTEIGKRHRFLETLEELRLAVQQELNFEREAQNLITVGNNLQEFEHVRIPQPIPDYCTRRVLTMDYVQGRKITALSPLRRLDLDAAPLAEELFRAYLKQILIDGIFHADPHPGNVFITDDDCVALLDLGMVGHTTPHMQDNLLKLLLAISQGESDEASDLVIRISQSAEDFDRAEFCRRVGQIMALSKDEGLQGMNVGKSLLDVTSSAADNGLFVPSELTLLGKTLLQLDEVGKVLDPNFNPNESVRRNVTELMTRRMRKEITPGNALTALLEMKQFVGGLPSRVNRIMDAVTNGDLEVKIRATDAKTVMEGLQKIANRITAGIVLAALIMGASTLMQTHTSFQIFGYPGLAMLCFLGAAAGGFWLLLTIFVQDRERRKKPSR